MKVWQPLTDDRFGYLFSLSDSFAILEASRPGCLVPASSGTMIVASDYSGQRKGASHEAYSFLVTTDGALNSWLPAREVFRKRWLPDGRRMSFKQLNERVRWRALPAFLETIGQLRGNLITILVDRRIGSFMLGGPDAAIEVFPDCFDAGSRRGTVEKMLRLGSFLALLLSGLRREDQVSNWISDHDEALDSHPKREQFARLATYLTFGLTGWQRPADNLFGTTEAPLAPFWSEDVAAIADLAAGAYCKMTEELPAFLGSETWQVRLASNQIANQRARMTGNWMAKGPSLMKHVLLRLEVDKNGDARASAQAFVGQGTPAPPNSP